MSSVKTRIQAAASGDGTAKPTIVDLLVTILRNEGISGYYKGFGANMLNTFSTRKAFCDRGKFVY